MHRLTQVPWYVLHSLHWKLLIMLFTRCLFRVKVMKFQLTFDESIQHLTQLLDVIKIGLNGKQSMYACVFNNFHFVHVRLGSNISILKGFTRDKNGQAIVQKL